MTATLPSTPARRLATVSSCVLVISNILYFVIPWMMGVAPPDPYHALGKIFSCVTGVISGLSVWGLGFRRTAMVVMAFEAFVFVFVLIGLA